MYVHGGAFCLLAADSYLKTVGHLATITHCQVVVPDYRLPPEYPYPLPLLEVLAVYAGLMLDDRRVAPVVVGGDSAGANLAVASLSLAARLGLPMPESTFFFSPWLDLTLQARSVTANASIDTTLDAASLSTYARAYAGRIPLNHPLVSPRVIEMATFPPVLIQAGEDELLVDDAHALAASAKERGGDVSLEVFSGMQHNFQFWGPLVPQAMTAIGSVALRISALEGLP
jgi:monoterpene epsilon-lactone hydrolase